jgi:hypothetical protein
MYNDDDFNWNHGLSLASTGNYKAAEVNISLTRIHDMDVLTTARMCNTVRATIDTAGSATRQLRTYGDFDSGAGRQQAPWYIDQ